MRSSGQSIPLQRPRGLLSRGLLCFALAAMAPPASRAQSGSAASPVTYRDHILPIVRVHCSGCHEGDDVKGGFDVSSLETLLAGGDEGPCIVPGRPAESFLLALVRREERPFMPPRRNEPLTDSQVELLRRWIEGGCLPGEVPRDEPASRPLPTYERPPAITALEYSPDGASLLVGGLREVLVHDVTTVVSDALAGRATPYPRARLPGGGDQVHDLTFSPRGEMLAVASGRPGDFGQIELFSWPDRRLLSAQRVGHDTLFDVAFSTDGERLVTAGAGPHVHVLGAPELELRYTAEVHADWVFGVMFSQSGERLATVARDRSVKVSSSENGQVVQRLAQLPRAAQCLARRPASDQFVVAGRDGRAVLFDASAMKKVRDLESQPGEVFAAAYRADGERLALVGSTSRVRIYNGDGSKRLAEIDIDMPWLFAVAFRSDGEQLAVGGDSGEVVTVDLAAGKVSSRFCPFPEGKYRDF